MKSLAPQLLLLLTVASCGRIGFEIEEDEVVGAQPDASTPDGPEEPDAEPVPDVITCGYSCSVDTTTGQSDCAAPVTGGFSNNHYVAQMDLTGFSELQLTFTVCDPVGWTVHVADSPTCDGFSGDASTAENDAEIHLGENPTTLLGYTNDLTPNGQNKQLFTDTAHVAATGCSTRTWVIADQGFRNDFSALNVTSEYLLRLNPPSDSQGTPDAFWYLGLNRTVGTSLRSGTGAVSAEICLR